MDETLYLKDHRCFGDEPSVVFRGTQIFEKPTLPILLIRLEDRQDYKIWNRNLLRKKLSHTAPTHTATWKEEVLSIETIAGTDKIIVYHEIR